MSPAVRACAAAVTAAATVTVTFAVTLALTGARSAPLPRRPVAASAVFAGFPMVPAAPPARAGLQPATSNITSADSLNWAGYAVSRSRVTFSAVLATFFVPYLDCADSPGVSLSSDWVGFDGFVGSANSVEQGGIAANCSATGKASYFGWYEMFPRAEVKASIKVAAGDSITASVTYLPKSGNFKITLTDNTRGSHFAVQRRCPHVRVGGRLLRCPRNSAEMISEAPATVTGKHVHIAHLADYGAVSFDAISITADRGARGGIVSPRWNATKIIQLGSPNGPVLARPTPTQAATFDTYWMREQ